MIKYKQALVFYACSAYLNLVASNNLTIEPSDNASTCPVVSLLVNINNQHTKDIVAVDGKKALFFTEWDEIYAMIPSKEQRSLSDELHYTPQSGITIGNYTHQIKLYSTQEYPNVFDVIRIDVTTRLCEVETISCISAMNNTNCTVNMEGKVLRVALNING